MLGERIKFLRNEKGLTLKQLGEILNLGESTMSMYENNKRSPSDDIKISIAEYFGVTLDYLLGRTDIRNPYEIKTIAAHHDGDDWTEEELSDIEKFKEYVRTKRES